MSVEPIKGVLSVYTNPLYGTLASELLRGYSAYNIAVMEGYEGTIDEWLASLVGPKGDKGDQGNPGLDGEQGPRGYTGETGPTGPKGDKGDKGETGNGIYAVVLRADYTLAIYFTDGSVYNTPSIRGREGAVGPTGPIGPQGETGPKGDTGNTGTGISSIVQNADHSLTINLDDGTSYTTDPVEAMKGDKGDTGNGISSIVMKSDYTLQINMTNGTSYNTPSIRGIQGETGPKGDTGATGPQGPKGDPGALNFHICSQSEYDATTRVPTVQNPEEDIFYLVPSASVTSPDLFVEWIYVNNAWEMFGSATVDIFGKADKVTNATSGNFASLDSNGNLTDSGHNPTEYGNVLSTLNQDISDLSNTVDGKYEKPSTGIPASDLASGVIPDVSGKADKVQNATSGNFASLDSNGNLIDSGHKHSDYLTQHQDISGKADKVINATSGNFAGLDSNGNLTDSGHNFTEINQELTSVKETLNNKYEKPSTGIPASDLASGVIPDTSGKADKVSGAISGNFASLDANGNLTDSGKKPSDFLTEHQDLTDYVKNTDYATSSVAGVVKVDGDSGTGMHTNGRLRIITSTSANIKAGTQSYRPIVPYNQHESTFYGLAKAAGDTTQSSSSNAVGTYTDDAKIAIQQMLGVYEAPFRIIKEVTISEETLTVHINTDSNGDTFELQEVIIYLKDTIFTNNGSVGFGFNMGTKIYDENGAFLYCRDVATTTANKSIVTATIRGGRFFAECLPKCSALYNYNYINASPNARGIIACDAIREITIRSVNDFKITSGEIIVYGR